MSRLFAAKAALGKWNALQSAKARVLSMHVHAKVIGKTNESKEAQMTCKFESLVRKKRRYGPVIGSWDEAYP